jgi:hypothetical protein
MEEALNTPGRLSPDEAVEMARQITERGRVVAQEHEQSQRFHQAAAFYNKIASVWQRVAARQIGDWQRYCQSLADYWTERADAARRRGDEEAEVLTSARLQVASQMLPASRGTPQKPITRPLSPESIRSDDDTGMKKGVVPLPSTSQSKDKKPFFRR